MAESEIKHIDGVRHSLAHLLAATVVEMYPGAKNAIGPAIENGFYQDFETPSPITEEDLGKIEKRMREVLKTWGRFERREVSAQEAREQFAWNPYKLELVDDFAKDGAQLTFYTSGNFVDLCRGGHVEDAREINPDAFKLTKVSGAYWRADQSNQQLQRIYGVAFETPEELKKHIQFLEEARKRDHRKLGQELDLFTFSDLVGPGLPMYTPRGTVLIEEIKNALRQISREHDMQLVSIPHLAKLDLYKISGHADKFTEELFRVQSHYDQEFILKPVNCPHHTQIYASRPRSYRELPLRYIEQTMQYRDEKPGQIGGLQRTRGFTVDDGHTFCSVEQIEQEASVLVEVIRQFYENLGLWGNHWVSLSVRDPGKPEAYIGDPKDWESAEAMLAKVADAFNLDAKRMEGEAAIYGPKIDFMFKDALGRETQLATVQLDFAMPKRFNLTYTDADGQERHPVMIHRAILGSFERFIMLLIEHFAGKFPVWLAPEQVRVITVNQEAATTAFAAKIREQAKELGLRLYVDNDNESVGKKIRNVEMMKVPYSVVIGQKEIETGEVVPRVRKDIEVSPEHEARTIEEFLKTVAHETKSRVNKTSL
jgi:threonyl-tRNA synthetase